MSHNIFMNTGTICLNEPGKLQSDKQRFMFIEFRSVCVM